MDDNLQENKMDPEDNFPKIDVNRSRYPYCIVWTPIPVLTWVQNNSAGDVIRRLCTCSWNKLNEKLFILRNQYAEKLDNIVALIRDPESLILDLKEQPQLFVI